MNSRHLQRTFLIALSLVAAIATSGCAGIEEDGIEVLDPGLEEAAYVGNPIDDSGYFITQLYADVLNRQPDAAGKSFWVGVLQNSNGDPAMRAAIATDFLESSEKRQSAPDLNPASPSYNSAFVTHCFTSFLQRMPDAGGNAYWLNYLNSTGDYDGVVGGFITSSEYRGRFGSGGGGGGGCAVPGSSSATQCN